jgi:uncharacterized protein
MAEDAQQSVGGWRAAGGAVAAPGSGLAGVEPSTDPAAGRGRVLAPIERAICLQLLATRPFGRLVYTHRALPEALPVNYRFCEDAVIIRLADGSTPAVAINDSVVAFQVDDIDVQARTGWSVTVVGHARELTDPLRVRRAAQSLTSWAGDERDQFFAVSTEKVSGRMLA